MREERIEQLQPPQQFLVFALGALRMAVRSRDIVEIVQMPELSALPKPLPIVEGAVNYRGRLAVVLDARRRFRLPAKAVEPSDHLIVLSLPARLVALRVDGALDLVTLDPDEIADPEALAPHDDYVAGVARHPDGLIVIHDLRTFLAVAEAEALDEALETAS